MKRSAKRLLSPGLLQRHAKRIRLLLSDIDGVLTNGTLYYVPDGKGGIVEAKGFNSQDGMGFRWLQEAGILAGWISGRESPGVVARAQILQISYLYQNHLSKVGPYEEILSKANVVDEEVCYMGDDIGDISIMMIVGLPVAVKDAPHTGLLCEQVSVRGFVVDVADDPFRVAHRRSSVRPQMVERVPVVLQAFEVHFQFRLGDEARCEQRVEVEPQAVS